MSNGIEPLPPGHEDYLKPEVTCGASGLVRVRRRRRAPNPFGGGKRVTMSAVIAVLAPDELEALRIFLEARR